MPAATIDAMRARLWAAGLHRAADDAPAREIPALHRETFDTGIAHGPYPACNVPGCPEPAYHLHGKRCAPHTFSPQLSGEPLPLRESMPRVTVEEANAEVRAMIDASREVRRGARYCPSCGTDEAMPGHEC